MQQQVATPVYRIQLIALPTLQYTSKKKRAQNLFEIIYLLVFPKKIFIFLGSNYLLSDHREGVMGCADQKRPIRWCCDARALYPQRACETGTLPGAPCSCIPPCFFNSGGGAGVG
jgi:hypothetical protein